MNPEQMADQDAFFASLLLLIHNADTSAPKDRPILDSVISAKAVIESRAGSSGALNANLPHQQALFEAVECDPRHNNGRNQTAKQRQCD